MLDGVVQADETYIQDNYKGNSQCREGLEETNCYGAKTR